MNDGMEETGTGTDDPTMTTGSTPGDPSAGPAVPPDGWREMNSKDLAGLCKSAGLPAGGTKDARRKRLDRHYYGSSKTAVNGLVVCPHCKAGAKCTGTTRPSDLLRRRFYCCSGRRRHRFTILSKLTPQTPGEGRR